MKQKIFTLFLALAASAGTIFADGTKIGDLYYNLDAVNKTAEVTYEENSSTDNYRGLTSVTIPTTINDNGVTYDVTGIGENAFWMCESLLSVTIPNSVKVIGRTAFWGCMNLNNVTIHEGVTTLDYNAFLDCGRLTSVEIPSSVTTISAAFDECWGLTAINVNTNNPNYSSENGVLFNKNKTYLIQYPGGKQDKSYSIPSSVTVIAGRAFKDCEYITEIIIPNSVTIIGVYAFHDCYALKSINIPEGVTFDGQGIFYGCRSLTSITIPNNIGAIGNNTFSSCSSLTSVTIPQNVYSIGSAAFSGCIGLTSITCEAITPPSCAYTYSWNEHESVFYEVDKSIPLYVPAESVEAYKSADVWKEFTNIQPINCLIASGTCGAQSDNLTWELSCDSVLTISGTGDMTDWDRDNHAPWYDFQNAIKDVVLLENVTSIGDYAFSGCASMTTVTIPSTIIQIRQGAFEGCLSLKGMYISNLAAWCSVQIEGDNSNPLVYAKHLFLNGEEIVDVVIPDGITSLRGTFYGYEGLKSVQFPKEFTNIGWSTFRNTGLSTFEIPEGIDTIGDAAFYGCKSLRSITLPTTLRLIDRFAFASSGLTSIEIPNSVTSIKPLVFYLCKELTSINVVADNPYYSSLDGVLLSKDQTTLALYPSGKQGAYVIPNSVTHIGDHAFNACSGLTSITCNDKTPPTCESTAFLNINKSIPLYVPAESVEAYKSANVWKEFTNIQPIPGTEPCLFASGTCGAQGDNLTWELSCDSVLTIRGTGAMTDYNWDSPWSIYKDTIKKVIVEEGVTSIGYTAFRDHGHLQECILPSTITSIGEEAFCFCFQLMSIEIPDACTSIGSASFNLVPNVVIKDESLLPYNGSARSVNGYVEGLFVYADSSKRSLLACSSAATGDIVLDNAIERIEYMAFAQCEAITNLHFGSHLQYIGEWSLNGCIGLEGLQFQEGLTEIADAAFGNCFGLQYVYLPNSLTTVGNFAIGNCPELRTIHLGTSLTNVGIQFFDYCQSLDTIYAPMETPPTLDNTAFSSTTLSNVVCIVPYKSLSLYQQAAVWKEMKLLAMDAPTCPYSGTCGDNLTWELSCDGVLTISGYGPMDVFCGPQPDPNPYLPAPRRSDGSVKSGLIFGCEAPWADYMSEIKEVQIADGVTSICSSAFENCTSLTHEVYIPSSITSIGDYAFYGCTGLPKVTFGSAVPPTISYGCFNDCPCNFYVPCGSRAAYREALGVGLDRIFVPNGCVDPGCNEVIVELDTTICRGDYIEFAGQQLYREGTYRDTFPSQWGCDTVLTLYLAIESPASVMLQQTIYEGDSLLFNGKVLTTQGIYQDTLRTKHGCDSIVTLVLFTEKAPDYLINATSNNAQYGSVEGGGKYTRKSQAILTAKPNEDYYFAFWNDGVTDNPRTITVTQDSSFTAIFRLLKYNVTVEANDPTMGNVSGGGEYLKNEIVTIMATPYKDCEFVQWSNGSTSNPMAFRVYTDSVFTAIFERHEPVSPIVASDTLYFTAADTTLKAARVYEPNEIQAYDRFVIATVDNNNVMGSQINHYRYTEAYSKDMSITNVSVVEAVPSGDNFRLQVEEGFLTPGGEGRNTIYSKELGADWEFVKYGNVVIPQAVYYNQRMILYNEQHPRFCSYRQVTGLDRHQTTIYKLVAPRNIPVVPVEIETDTTALQEEDNVIEDIPTEITPEDTLAVISTPYVEFVFSFTIIIWADINHTQVLLILTFNGSGQLIATTSPRSIRRSTLSNNISFEIGDLLPETEYYYSLMACDDDGSVLKTVHDTFTTKKKTPTSVEEIQESSDTEVLKFIQNGQLFILRNGEMYNAQGARVE